MAYKSKKSVNTQTTTVEQVEAKEAKKANSLKDELVNLYKALDSINLEEQNEKIKQLSEKLAQIIEEYDTFVLEDNKRKIETAEKIVLEGDMIVKRFGRSDVNVVKPSDTRTPFSLGFKDVLLFALTLVCIALVISLIFLV